MKIAQFSRFGRPDAIIESVEVEEPSSPKTDEAALEVLTFPINPADLPIIEGLQASQPPLPACPGSECVARVLAVGNVVDDLYEGDLVILLDRENWVQRKVSKASRLIKVPTRVDPLQLDMLKAIPPTGCLMITRYVDLARGDWLLQDAANSGVGQCLIQLTKAEGFRTVNIVHREGPAEELAELGADVVLVDGADLAQRISAATKGAPSRFAIDVVGGSQIVRFGDALADGAIVLN